MSVTLRSFAKINLGLCIGGLRPEGFHELRTIYQTIALHDVIRVRVSRGKGIEIRCEASRVPKDQSNTCWRIVERAIELLEVPGRVVIEIEKRLPVQGGLGGASGNAVAALVALEIALKKRLSLVDKLRIAGEVGSDLPLFLIGGTVLGTGRGEEVYPLADLPPVHCVIALPEIGVSTPQAFADWDLLISREPQGLKPDSFRARGGTAEVVPSQPGARVSARVRISDASPAELSPAWTGKGARPNIKQNPAERSPAWTGGNARPYTVKSGSELTVLDPSDRMNEFSRRISAWLSSASGVPVSKGRGRAETPLLDLVRTGIENDFEQVVFPKYPELREAKSVLEGAGALYASLSGSGSAIYGLFESKKKAEAGAAALRKTEIPAVVTSTLTRSRYWKRMSD